MTYTIRVLAWVSFWILLFLAATTDWNEVMRDWRSIQSQKTTFPSSKNGFADGAGGMRAPA